MSASGEGATPTPEYDDYYSNYYEDDICTKSAVIQFGAIVTPAFFSVIIVLSLVGNTLVLVVVVRYENLKSLTNAFILNLAVSDLIFTFGLPFWASYHMFGWTFSENTCKAVSFVFNTGFYSSTIFLTVMTIHRYMAVVRPMSMVVTKKTLHCVIASVAVWTVSFSVATPALIFSKTQVNHNDNVTHCGYGDNINWKRLGTYQQNIFFIVAFAVISFCYVQIVARLLRPTSHTRRKTVRLILSIVVVFFLGWAPYNVALFLQSLTDWEMYPFNDCDVSTKVDYVYYVCRLVAYSHCCLNPVFYVFVGIKFRTHLKKMLQAFCMTVSDPQNRNSRLIYSEEFSMY